MNTIGSDGRCSGCGVKCQPTEEDEAWDYCTCPRTTANIYRHGSRWAYALFIGGEFDHSDALPDAGCQSEAEAEVRGMFADCDVRRVADIAEAAQ